MAGAIRVEPCMELYAPKVRLVYCELQWIVMRIRGFAHFPRQVLRPWFEFGFVERVTSGAHLQDDRSEEHTSELQSLAYLVCRLLLEKKNKKQTSTTFTTRRKQHAS